MYAGSSNKSFGLSLATVRTFCFRWVDIVEVGGQKDAVRAAPPTIESIKIAIRLVIVVEVVPSERDCYVWCLACFGAVLEVFL